MVTRRSTTSGIRLVRRLGSVTVRWHAVVDRREVRLVVCSALERRDDVIHGVGSRVLADVADASVSAQDPRTQSFPVRWQRCAAVSGHARIVPSKGECLLRGLVMTRAQRDVETPCARSVRGARRSRRACSPARRADVRRDRCRRPSTLASHRCGSCRTAQRPARCSRLAGVPPRADFHICEDSPARARVQPR